MTRKIFAALVLTGVLSAGAAAHGAAMHDELLTATKPDSLFVVDPQKRAVVSQFHIPGAHDYVGTIVPSPHGRIAYLLINGMESIAGIDLKTGREVFRADLSSPGERVRCVFGFDVTPDGKDLIVYEVPTRLGIDEYTAEPPRFAIFSTAGGLHAQPLREFPAPRRIAMVLAKRDGRSFYAIGFNLYQFDLKTGRLIGKRGILDWNRPNHSIPDLLAVWPVSEPTGIFSTPIYSTLTGPGLPAAGVPETSLMTLNLRTGALAYHDFERTTAPIFTTVVSPNRRWAYGVYTQLTKIDTRRWDVARQVNLPHTYYSVAISSDGRDVYAGGTMCDIAIYDAKTLRQKGDIKLPGCGDQATATMRLIEVPSSR